MKSCTGDELPHKGRGAQHNPVNRYLKHHRQVIHIEAIDEAEGPAPATQYIEEHARALVNRVDSPDVGMFYSMNPYQGCEHGCAYCYARNSHEYWGFSAGIDFEQKIVVKRNAPELLRKFLMKPGWQCVPLSLSGNTDCYQPAERQFRITRRLLEVCHEFRQPVGILTKNALVLRDMDLLQEMAAKGLVQVLLTITTLDARLRHAMEPRTTTPQRRLQALRELSAAGIPTGVMLGPVIPALNDHEMPRILEAAAKAGARKAAYTFIRLNGSVQLIFREWLQLHFPDRTDRVWHLIEASHGGKVNDSRFGVRMRGEGPVAQIIRQQFHTWVRQYGLDRNDWSPDCSGFRRPGGQLSLFT